MVTAPKFEEGTYKQNSQVTALKADNTRFHAFMRYGHCDHFAEHDILHHNRFAIAYVHVS
jgi:hypothetical protein